MCEPCVEGRDEAEAGEGLEGFEVECAGERGEFGWVYYCACGRLGLEGGGGGSAPKVHLWDLVELWALELSEGLVLLPEGKGDSLKDTAR